MSEKEKLDEKQRRIAACLNAFDGIPTDKIEGKNLGEILAGEMRLNNAGPRADGGFGFEFSGGVCQLMAEAFAEQFKQSGAINYLELLFDHSDIGPLTITMQRVDGLTPAHKLAKAESERDALQQKLDAVLAENVALKNGIGFFSYGSDSGFEEHDSAEKAIAAADADIDYYRGDACDGWSEETDQTVWGVILQRATMVDERPRTEEDSYLGSHISSVCDYALLPNLATPATDAMLNAVRAEGIYFAANRMLAAWDSGFIDDTPAQAYDISGAVLSAVEFLPDASPEDFKRNFAESIRAEIAAKPRAETETTSSQYESLAGGK